MNDFREYTPETLTRARATALTIAQVIGDDLLEDTVVVGGLVPPLLLGSAAPDPLLGAHVGTHDFDLALDLAIFDEERYAQIDERLRQSGFAPDVKRDEGTMVRQRWRYLEGLATVEFIMPPVSENTRGVQSLTRGLAALRMLGIDLALERRERVVLSGSDLRGYTAERTIPVCRLAPFVVLKALAIGGRDKPKDAYDLYFVLRNASGGPVALAQELHSFLDHPAVVKGRAFLERDFASVDGRGPGFVAEFLGQRDDADLAADVLAYVAEFIAALA